MTTDHAHPEYATRSEVADGFASVNTRLDQLRATMARQTLVLAAIMVMVLVFGLASLLGVHA
jgi:hypothetical protein